MKQPTQPLERDDRGVIRFKQTTLVRHLLDWATSRGLGLNELAMLPNIPVEDHQQLAQLIGYSLAGYGELSYVDSDAYDVAVKMIDTDKSPLLARLEAVEATLAEVRDALRDPIARLYGVHPDDLR